MKRLAIDNTRTIECVGWRHHSSLIFLILLFSKTNIECSGLLYQTKTLITHIVYQPYSRVMPPIYIALLTLKSLSPTCQPTRKLILVSNDRNGKNKTLLWCYGIDIVLIKRYRPFCFFMIVYKEAKIITL